MTRIGGNRWGGGRSLTLSDIVSSTAIASVMPPKYPAAMASPPTLTTSTTATSLTKYYAWNSDEITDSDTVPDLPVDRGHQVWPRAPQPLQLKADDRLWLATPGDDGVATLGVLTP